LTKAPNRQVSLDSRRIHLEREIAIRVPQFDSFVTEYSGNISTTGMFILTDKPLGHGTELTFEFSVADDWKLIRGKAQVVWTRYGDEGPDRPPGMGVRFTHLDAQSRRLIRWIVEKHIREGGKPFELEELRSVIDDALDDVLVEDPDEGMAATVARTPSRSAPTLAVGGPTTKTAPKQLLPLLVTAAGVVALVAALFWLTEWLPERSRAREQAASKAQSTAADPSTADTELAQTADSTIPEPTAADDDSTVTASPAPPPNDAAAAAPRVSTDVPPKTTGSAPIGSAYRAVRKLIEAWATAWSDQDVTRYLSFYSRGFRPKGGQSLAGWTATRRDRLRTPKYIKVSVSGLEMERLDNNTVRVRFFQNYRSDRFTDSVQKTLDLAWEDGAWKIAREVS